MFIQTEMVTMRDGAKMFTVVFKPQAEGKYPIIFVRSPYTPPYEEITEENYEMLEGMTFGISLGTTVTLKDTMDAGYCYVLQHGRGTGNSEGIQDHMADDYNDTNDTLDWIRKQDFYDGEIFMTGSSYLSWNALLMAGDHHKDIKGLVLIVPNFWHYAISHLYFSTL